jgi:uncharacterized protein (TIGR02246 family)
MPAVGRALAVAALVAGLLGAAGSAFAQAGLSHPRNAADVFVKATAAGDAEAIASLYAPNAIFLAPNTPVISGRPSIRAIFERNFKAGANAIKFLDVRVDGAGDRAIIVWEWISEIKPASGAASQMHGRSMVYFVKSAAGWLISADMMQPAPKR